MLPIRSIYADVIQQLQQHNTLLLQAPPGAGKSTWLPLQLMRDGHYKRIIMLEPRRLAARNIAHYLAECQNEPLGQSIGLRIRQEHYHSANTQLEIVTEGILTRMLQNDAELQGVDCLIFDEFHERSLAADTALAFALESQSILRDDLRILIMSATLDSGVIAEKLQCPVITSTGKSFAVEEIYQPLQDDKAWLAAMPNLVKKALSEQSGNCLVFLPGQKEIRYLQHNLSDLESHIEVFALYGEQNKAQQQAAIAPTKAGQRKVVLATNVAETSLTIEGIRIVVDSGKRRQARLNMHTGVNLLSTVDIAMASAIQRAGRAGRLEPGVVYRLGSKERFSRREQHDKPDILTADISPLLLESAQWGAAITDLPLLDYPSKAQIDYAYQLLRMLEAIDEEGKITAIGEKLLNAGTDYRWAYMLHKAEALKDTQPNIRQTAVYLLALLESRSNEPELTRALQRQLHDNNSAFKQQLRFWQQRFGISGKLIANNDDIALLVALAYPDRIAKRRGNSFLLANGAGIQARDDTWPNSEYLAIAELGGQKGDVIFSATELDIAILEEALPHLFEEQIVTEFDPRSGRFIHEQRLQLGAITISSKPAPSPLDTHSRSQAWLKLIAAQGFMLFNDWTDKASDQARNPCVQYQTRLQLAHELFSEQFPAADESYLLAHAKNWLLPYLANISNVEQLKKLDLLSALQSLLSWQQQQQLNCLLPERITVPSGSAIRVTYQLSGPARLAVRMQEVFGMATTPSLAQGKLALQMDLLSPAQRSLQLTQDLASFWQNSYREVQKEMKGRYPKHHWPDNPAEAQASAKTTRRSDHGRDKPSNRTCS